MLFERSSRTIKFGNSEIPEPRVLIDFLGFEKHTVQIRDKRGTKMARSVRPCRLFFHRPATGKNYQTGDEVIIPSFIQAPDYEFEIGCIVTKYGMPKTMEEAIKFFSEHCYLTILNDWSARDIQKKDIEGLGPTHSKSIMGKSLLPRLWCLYSTTSWMKTVL